MNQPIEVNDAKSTYKLRTTTKRYNSGKVKRSQVSREKFLDVGGGFLIINQLRCVIRWSTPVTTDQYT